MNIYITYDYELFFGEITGTPEKCILEPTQQLIEIGRRSKAKFTFFIDIGYIIKLKEFQEKFPQLKSDYQKICAQIKLLIELGHACELHIHPHWEDSFYNGKKWVMNTSRYKLTDFEKEDAIEIIKNYYTALKNITQAQVTCFRAGGWCLQPFEHLHDTFSELGIVIDSTVFREGYYEKGNYYYDFRNSPELDFWTIKTDLVKHDKTGKIKEFPIASKKYSPLFFWRLFLLGRLFPKNHKPIGDGFPMSSPGLRKEMLTKGKLLSASVDGYFVTQLSPILKFNSKRQFNHLVIIGHPKANTNFALSRLEKFILKHQNQNKFVPLPSAIEHAINIK